jgi:hypothetical protein
VQLDKDAKDISHQIYKEEYNGCWNKILCGCFYTRLKQRRHMNVLKEFRQYKNGDTDEELAPFIPILLITPMIRMISLYGLMNNFIMIYQTYQIAIKEENIEKWHYKVVVIVQFVSIFSLYLISYSTLNYSLYFNGGKGANLKFENMDWRKKLSLMFGLLFIAPLKFVLLEFFVAINVVVKFFAVLFVMFGLIKSTDAVDDFLNKIFRYGMNIDSSQLEIF